MSEAKREEQYNRHRRDNYHQYNLSAGGQQPGEAAEILRYFGDISGLPDDLASDPVMGQTVSELTSTANLTAEQVRSHEWLREIILVLYLCNRPTKDGVNGGLRAWVTDDADEDIEPISAQKRAMLEAFIQSGNLALSRSEDFTAATESIRNVSESVVHDEASSKSSGGGILGRLRG